MKTKYFYISLFIIAILSCESNNQTDGDMDDNSSKSYPVELRARDYNVPVGCNDNKIEADTLYVINSQNELLSWVPCANGVSDIDWDKETLLITWDRRCNADSRVLEKKFEETAKNVFLFQIKIAPSLTANAAPLIIYMIVPKLPKNAEVGFDIILQGSGNNATFQLKDTQWKLAGFYDVADKKLIEAEPKDCEACYTLVFQTDSLGFAKSVENEIMVDLGLPPFFLAGTKINDSETGNVGLFYEAIKTIDSYRLEDGKLKFFYDSKKKYLLYEQMENTTPSGINKIETQDYSLIETSCSWQHSKLKADSIYMINSQEELFSIVSCGKNDVPNIDFDKHSLLFVYGRTTSGISSINKILQKTTETNYVLSIDIQLNMTTVAQRWEIALSTPKIPKNTVLELEKNVHY